MEQNRAHTYTKKPRIYVQLIFNSNAKVFQCGKDILFNTGG